MFKTTACSFYFPSFSAVTGKLGAVGKTKKKVQSMDYLLVIKIPFQQLLQLIFIRGSWSFNKPVKGKNMQITC